MVTTNDSYSLIESYYKTLTDVGWKQTDMFGRQHYYEKEINGKLITISVLPIEQGNISGNKVKVLFDFFIPNKNNAKKDK